MGWKYLLLLVLLLPGITLAESSDDVTPSEFASKVSNGEIVWTTVRGTQLALKLKSLWADRPVTFSHGSKSYLVTGSIYHYGHRTIWKGSSGDGYELVVSWDEGLKTIATFTIDGETSTALPLRDSENHVLLDEYQLADLTDFRPLGISSHDLKRHAQVLALSSFSPDFVYIGKRGIVDRLGGKSLGKVIDGQIEFDEVVKKGLMLTGTEEFTILRDEIGPKKYRWLFIRQSIRGISVSHTVAVGVDPETSEIKGFNFKIIPDFDLPEMQPDYVSGQEAEYLAREAIKWVVESTSLNDVLPSHVELAYKIGQADEVHLVWVVHIVHEFGAHRVFVDTETRSTEVKPYSRS